MKFLLVLALVATAAALPRKPTKTFPKKYESSIDGHKDTYSHYGSAPDEDLVVPAENPTLDVLQAPSSYDAYFERPAQDPLQPPSEVSTYLHVSETSEGEALIPPPIDSYSDHSGVGHSGFVPPPKDTKNDDEVSYVAYEAEGQDPIVAPALSSYAENPQNGRSGADVLASMAAMVHSIPELGSYQHYNPTVTDVDNPNAPSVHLMPPSAQEKPQATQSSYSKVSANPPSLTADQIMAAEEAFISLPVHDLIPPTL